MGVESAFIKVSITKNSLTLVRIPDKLEEWNVELLNRLVSVRDIEADTFDFKGHTLDKLETHICAMANTRGGHLVLGIDELTENGHKLGFKKVGFKAGKEDAVKNTISNYLHRVEPIPHVDIVMVVDNDRFYPVLRIESVEDDKPYFVKESWQCWIRVSNSTRAANRSEILNLSIGVRYSNEERRQHTHKLKEDVFKKLMDIQARPVYSVPVLDKYGNLKDYECELEEKAMLLDFQIPKDYDRYHKPITKKNDLLESMKNFQAVNHLDYFDWAIQHLGHRDYANVLKQWNDACGSVQRFNELALKLLSLLEEQAKVEMKKLFPMLVDTEDDSGLLDFTKCRYLSKNIGSIVYRRLYFKFIYRSDTPPLNDTYFNDLRRTKLDKQWVILGPDLVIASVNKDDIDVYRFKNACTNLKYYPGIEKGFEELASIYETVTQRMEKFKLELSKLIKDFDGGDLIKGRCKIGY